MGLLRSAALALLPFFALYANAQVEVDEEPITADQSPKLGVSIQTTFPNSEIFGIKLVNGHATQAVLSVVNTEAEPVSVQMVGGSLWDLTSDRNVRNLTATPYNVVVPAGQNQSLTYNFATELHPQDLRLFLAAIVVKGENGFQVPAFNATVSVVEAPLSFFDPQMIFLYLFLSATFAGTCYFIYSTWIATLFPQKKRGGKGGERAKTSSKGTKAVNPADQVAVGGADGPAVTSGAKAIDSSWIPAQHLQRPEAKRIRSGTPKTKTK